MRLSLSRTISSRKARHAIAAQTVIESYMAEVNMLWAAKTPEAYVRDLDKCQMCDPAADAEAGCVSANDKHKNYTCNNIDIYDEDDDYTVEAKIESSESGATEPCKITYTITHTTNGVSDARQTL